MTVLPPLRCADGIVIGSHSDLEKQFGSELESTAPDDLFAG